MLDRDEVLANAQNMISNARAADYSPAGSADRKQQVLDQFGRLGRMWGATLGVPDIPPSRVLIMLAQLKLARLVDVPNHEDSYIDAAGYVALAGEAGTTA